MGSGAMGEDGGFKFPSPVQTEAPLLARCKTDLGLLDIPLSRSVPTDAGTACKKVLSCWSSCGSSLRRTLFKVWCATSNSRCSRSAFTSSGSRGRTLPGRRRCKQGMRVTIWK
eukprot:1889535-Amphidinium_carterae.1